MARAPRTILPFLYPCLHQSPSSLRSDLPAIYRFSLVKRNVSSQAAEIEPPDEEISSHLNPLPSDYGRSIFADKASLTVSAGSGGHGCVSFLREKFLDNGPPNGGDGGTGGSVYIQAIREEKSLHKLARQRFVRAGRGKNGQGKSKGGKRGEDVLIQVPVGTVIRETSREDPAIEERRQPLEQDGEGSENADSVRGTWRRDRWVLYPATRLSEYTRTEFPPLPKSRGSQLASAQLPGPIHLDLSRPMERPMLLAAGGAGGFGNPHFVSRSNDRPKFATKGERGTSVTLELELKLLADLGFVGMPNAGKSTLLRALSRSRARVGSWAFTTLQPNIGTMILDNHRGRPQVQARTADGQPRTQVSIADIPGLIKNAHLDKGLGLGFLRHVERAKVLAFIVDLSRGDAVESLKALWEELGEFERLKSMETNIQTESRHGAGMDQTILIEAASSQSLPPLDLVPISTKPWFVVATKADLVDTQKNFAELGAYLDALNRGAVGHPSGIRNAWKGPSVPIPVSAIRGEGVGRIPEQTVSLLVD